MDRSLDACVSYHTYFVEGNLEEQLKKSVIWLNKNYFSLISKL
jgi:hypothetical protein